MFRCKTLILVESTLLCYDIITVVQPRERKYVVPVKSTLSRRNDALSSQQEADREYIVDQVPTHSCMGLGPQTPVRTPVSDHFEPLPDTNPAIICGGLGGGVYDR